MRGGAADSQGPPARKARLSLQICLVLARPAPLDRDRGKLSSAAWHGPVARSCYFAPHLRAFLLACSPLYGEASVGSDWSPGELAPLPGLRPEEVVK